MATDGSAVAEHAVSAGVKLAAALNARLTFVIVLAPLTSIGDYDDAFAGAPEAVRQNALEYMADKSATETSAGAGEVPLSRTCCSRTSLQSTPFDAVGGSRRRQTDISRSR